MKLDPLHPRAQRHTTLRFVALGVAALALSGCSAGGGVQQVFTDTARSFLSARAYDRATVAAQREDTVSAVAAFQDYLSLQKGRALPPQISDSFQQIAESFVEKGEGYDTQAGNQPEGSPSQSQLLKLSADAYRSAMTLSRGKFASDDPQLLNALGYFLADRGASPADFKEAERLTRLSLDTYTKLVQQPGVTVNQNVLTATRGITRDSLAWALYKQGRYNEAQSAQETALKELRAGTSAVGTPDTVAEPELTYHLAMIYAAQHKTDVARTTFQKALQLRPRYPAAQKGLQSLRSSASANL